MAPFPSSIHQRRALVDSSAYLAFVDADDANHAAALAIMRGLVRERYRDFTTNYLLAETHALVLSTLGTAKANELLVSILDGRTVVVRANTRDEAFARNILFRYNDKTFSYTDAISFAVMYRLGIPLAFSFDDDFRQYGLTLLTPDFFR